ncbi:beta strand repeat-containing protein [Aeoliella sp. SH292]|uniref:beta strand repeat-containing protein n=1 Tax=Aeoliella sp. SH292 TaxID=3454464 RepID=UPI003F94AE30
MLITIDKYNSSLRVTWARVLAVLLAALAASVPQQAPAYWLGTISGDWNFGGNWLGFSQPGPSDAAEFPRLNGFPTILRSAVDLSANTTVASMAVDGDLQSVGPYTFTRTNNAVLTVNGLTRLGSNSGSPFSTTTFNGFQLNTNNLTLLGAATGVLTGGADFTSSGVVELYNTSKLTLNSGTLNAAGGVNLFDGAVLQIDSGGTLNMNSGTTMNLHGATSRLQLNKGFAFSPGTTINTSNGGFTPGADIVGTSFIDIGNGGANTVNLNGAGTTFTAAGSTVSDWGLGASGSATVNLSNSAIANVQKLNIANGSGNASINVNSSSQLNIGQTLLMGGGASGRFIGMSINGGTVDVTGAATYNDFADTDLISGTLRYRAGATINALARLDITGGTLDTTNQTLTVNGGTLTSTTTGALSSNSALIVQGGGTASFAGFFDIGSGNLAGLTVTGNGSTYSAGGLSDWGRGASGEAVVGINSNAIATLDSLRIGTDNGTASVTVTSGAQLRPAGLTVGGGSNNRTVNLTVSGGTLSVTDPNSITTFNDKAVLNLQSGTFDPKGNVTFFAGAVANISGGTFLTPSGKFLTVSGGLINRSNPASSGISPGATLAINSAGTYASVGSFSVGEFGTGTITVDGANSVFRTSTNLTLGGSTAGQVGTVTTTNGGRLHVGDAANQSGVFAANDMFVSDLNNPASDQGGFLRVSNGSALTHAGNILVASQANEFGQVRVDGTNSELISTGLAVIGRFGSATLDVLNGGAVRSDIYVQSFDPGSNSTTSVTGAASLLDVAGDIVVGRAGGAFLDIRAGGRAESGGTTRIGEISSAGAINVTGANSTLEAGTQIHIGVGGTGRLTVSDGGNVTTPIVTVGGASELSVHDASVTGDVTLLANSVMLADNATVGPLTQQAGADLQVILRGTSDFDNLHVLGPAILRGDLLVFLDEGFIPQAGDSFEFLTSSGEISAIFGSTNLPALSGGLEWQLDFSPQALTLNVIGGLPGDYNNDGTVNLADYTVWRDNLGASITLPNDSTPGTVTGDDYTVWKTNFGSAGGPGALDSIGGNQVPEPGSVFTLLVLLSCLIAARRFPSRCAAA